MVASRPLQALWQRAMLLKGFLTFLHSLTGSCLQSLFLFFTYIFFERAFFSPLSLLSFSFLRLFFACSFNYLYLFFPLL
ncbi:hypothetical protein HDV57DRAFT_259323 [Trichoderma longibrachiatum]